MRRIRRKTWKTRNYNWGAGLREETKTKKKITDHLQERRRKKRRQMQTGKLIRKCMKRASKKGRIKILRARIDMRKKRRRRKRWEDHPSWLGGSGPGFFSGMIGDHWHSLDTDQSSSVSVRHDWSKKMVVARAQNKIFFTSPAIWGRWQPSIFFRVTHLHLSFDDGQAGCQPQLTIVCK